MQCDGSATRTLGDRRCSCSRFSPRCCRLGCRCMFNRSHADANGSLVASRSSSTWRTCDRNKDTVNAAQHSDRHQHHRSAKCRHKYRALVTKINLNSSQPGGQLNKSTARNGHCQRNMQDRVRAWLRSRGMPSTGTSRAAEQLNLERQHNHGCIVQHHKLIDGSRACMGVVQHHKRVVASGACVGVVHSGSHAWRWCRAEVREIVCLSTKPQASICYLRLLASGSQPHNQLNPITP
jgi:hypothetical protein